jgi:hypothetical protein
VKQVQIGRYPNLPAGSTSNNECPREALDLPNLPTEASPTRSSAQSSLNIPLDKEFTSKSLQFAHLLALPARLVGADEGVEGHPMGDDPRLQQE